MKIIRNICLLTVLIALMFMLCSCSTFDNFKHHFFHEAGTTEETIKFGIIEPQTGSDKNYGSEEIIGFRIANEIVPEVLGKKIEMVYVDTQSDMDVAESTIAGLIEREPAVVLGGYGNVVSLVASNLLGEAKIPTIGTTSTNPLIVDNNSCYFRVGFTGSAQGRTVADYIVGALNLDSAMLIKIKGDETTTEMCGKFMNRMESKTGNSDSVKEIIYIDPSAPDYGHYVDIIAKNDVKAVFMPTGLNTAEEIFREANDHAKNVTFIGPNSWQSEDLISIAMKYPNIHVAVVSDVINSTENLEESNADTTYLHEKLAEKYGELTSADATIPNGTALAFDAYMVAIKAIENAGSTESADIIKQLKEIKNFPGASGKITFNENGEASKPINVDIVEEGKFITVYTSK